ncbi:MAG: alpha/beta hydrolase [Vicinamibacterales bacterium]
MRPPTAPDVTLAGRLRSQVDVLGLETPEPAGEPESIAARRRRRGAPRGSARATVSLVRVDGVLRWTYHRPPRVIGPRRAFRANTTLVRGSIVSSFSFKEVPPNRVVEQLEQLDTRLTPARGLRRWQGGALTPVTLVEPTPRLLLVIHGTFSKGDVIFDEWRATASGRQFLQRAETTYGQILAFDHPTLSVSPVLNALDLDRALEGYPGVVDIICHSRGGLVAAWWLKLAPRKVGKVVFVGSPLEGTNLASPARLKESLDVLANIADTGATVTQAAGMVAPWSGPLLGVAAGLMQALGAVLSVGARTPLLDAGVAVVAGLASQSRVSNNQELLRLHERPWPSTPDCYAVTSDFEPGNPDSPAWQFWKRLRQPLLTVANAAVDPIFQGPNDLVVENVSMTRLLNAPLPVAQVKNFGTNNTVHHCNYFAQDATVTFLVEKLFS